MNCDWSSGILTGIRPVESVKEDCCIRTQNTYHRKEIIIKVITRARVEYGKYIVLLRPLFIKALFFSVFPQARVR